jgi:hypothetical protein
MPASKEIFQKYLNPLFIETGTWHGDGVQQALDAGFKNVVSFELSTELHYLCSKRFEGNFDVTLFQGDSAEELPKFIKHITTPITFWLDGHFSGGDTAMGKQNTPLLEELEAIKAHPIKTHTILIDDLRGWYKETQGFDTLDLMKKILEISPNYVFTLEDGYVPNDILVAKCL